MNQHIPPEVNAVFVSTGCTPAQADNVAADYFHASADIFLRFCTDLTDERNYTNAWTPTADSKEVVIVIPDGDELHAPVGRGRQNEVIQLTNEVIRLKDLAHFLTHRVFGPACFDHRIKKQCKAGAMDKVMDAYDAGNEAEEAVITAKAAWDAALKLCHEASKALEASPPPRYYAQVATA